MAKYLLNTTSLAPKILIALSIFMGVAGFFILSNNSSVLLEWVVLNLLLTPVKFTLILDPVGLIYASTVLFIAANVIRFSKFYMHEDPLINRFSILVMFFVASILTLIFVPHFIALLLGWDGLGITSFILIIYYQNPKSLGAGIVTALINRIGDVIILIAIGLTLDQGHWTITHIWLFPNMQIQALIIMVAGCTKRAQIPFSSWLPAAIAAPTPVSALVHSSTLVTAGVFLLIRFYPFLHLSLYFNKILLFTAVITIFMAGIRAATECDIKKIIALSTLSQLGIIICSLGLGAPIIALFHIITHALFKALLFICAGQSIADHAHGQDLRWMGNLPAQNPVTTSSILIANIALCGLPFLAGFYSKDLIIEYMLTGGFNLLILNLTFVAVGLTALYSIRFSLIVIWAPIHHSPLFNLDEKLSTAVPIIIISFISIIIGSCLLWLMPIINRPFHITLSQKLIPIIIIVSGVLVRWWLSLNNSTKPANLLRLHLSNYASCIIWFLAPLSTQPIINPSIKLSHHLLKTSDQAWLEQLSAQGIFSGIMNSRSLIQGSNMYSPTRLILRSVIATSYFCILIPLIRC
jgi:NADH-ubiquinone oxidoreductase chain 5